MSKSEHPDAWRRRLREALDRHWKKRAAIAEDAGTNPETLSRIITGRCSRPGFDIVVRLAHAAGVTVGSLLGEPGYRLSQDRKARLAKAAEVIDEILRED